MLGVTHAVVCYSDAPNQGNRMGSLRSLGVNVRKHGADIELWSCESPSGDCINILINASFLNLNTIILYNTVSSLFYYTVA